MNSRLAIFALAGSALAGQAAAQVSNCGPANSVRVANTSTSSALTNIVNGRTVCASRNGQRWQEFHSTGGRVIDYKRGPADPVDPSTDVASWAITGTGTSTFITYDYGTGGQYTYAVFRLGQGTAANYYFCGVSGNTNNGNNVTNARILTGQVPCP